MSGSATERGYLKFDVAGVTGPVTGVAGSTTFINQLAYPRSWVE